MLGALVAMLGEQLGSPRPSSPAWCWSASPSSPPICATRSTDPGTTSVAALVLCYCLGAAWLGHTRVAVMLAVGTTVLLYFKASCAAWRRGWRQRDWISILQFGVLSLVILPMLPDEEMGPHGALNPRQIWWMVVLIAGVGLAGYTRCRSPGCAMAQPSSASLAAWLEHGDHAAVCPPGARAARGGRDGRARDRDRQPGDGAAGRGFA